MIDTHLQNHPDHWDADRMDARNVSLAITIGCPFSVTSHEAEEARLC